MPTPPTTPDLIIWLFIGLVVTLAAAFIWQIGVATISDDPERVTDARHFRDRLFAYLCGVVTSAAAFLFSK